MKQFKGSSDGSDFDDEELQSAIWVATTPIVGQFSMGQNIRKSAFIFVSDLVC